MFWNWIKLKYWYWWAVLKWINNKLYVYYQISVSFINFKIILMFQSMQHDKFLLLSLVKLRLVTVRTVLSRNIRLSLKWMFFMLFLHWLGLHVNHITSVRQFSFSYIELNVRNVSYIASQNLFLHSGVLPNIVFANNP